MTYKFPLYICLLLNLSMTIFPWGKTGHRVVGEIAQKNLNRKSLNGVQLLIGQKSLAQVSNWGDDVRDDPNWKQSLSWHFVDIPKGKRYRDLPEDQNVDIVEAIQRFQKELASPQSGKKQKIIALKWLVHLIGDIHQPLHTGIPGDQGGNLVDVHWFGKKTNLHKVWDEHCIDDELLSFREYADFLNQLPYSKIQSLQKAEIYEWVQESRSYLDLVYEIGDKKLSYPYRSKIRPVIEKRMLEAGIRLAGVLNRAFSSDKNLRETRPKLK